MAVKLFGLSCIMWNGSLSWCINDSELAIMVHLSVCCTTAVVVVCVCIACSGPEPVISVGA